jgi:hypothetical protein
MNDGARCQKLAFSWFVPSLTEVKLYFVMWNSISTSMIYWKKTVTGGSRVVELYRIIYIYILSYHPACPGWGGSWARSPRQTPCCSCSWNTRQCRQGSAGLATLLLVRKAYFELFLSEKDISFLHRLSAVSFRFTASLLCRRNQIFPGPV